MELKKITRPAVLYVFGGEKAQGAEIVIERLISYNTANVEAHLILSPGKFADQLLSLNKPYKITTLADLRKLNRSTTGKIVYYLKALTNFFTVSYKIRKYIKQNNITMVHANTMVIASYHIPLILYSRVFSPSVKWYWSDHDLKYFNNLDISISQKCFRLYDKTLVVSKILKKKYTDSDKVVVLHNGLDTTVFQKDAHLRKKFRDSIDINYQSVVIGLAAVISPDKGQMDLINAFKYLSKKFVNIKLVLAGGFANDTPEYGKQVESAIKQNSDVVYIGSIDHMTEFYNGCDIIVNNSSNRRSEPLGTTIYEAMACEKIVLASNTGGTPEIISDGEDGFIFTAESREDLQQKLGYAIQQLDNLDSIRSAARKKAIEKFNIKIMVKSYNEILKIS